ncbi:LOW QUALITY PROTEIN: hypothetical protein TorRG33x02_249670 [Trema orientale]|uniref:Uncharacterized protein n=1 Tax=Trema orientale TaxID=63057 RepID=A0A2P5DJL1_TREOI|nr:LOW QUALITY PROTEIN: hypothetical protein TorRG33x02_249670 [Trema orientale]
MAAFSSRLVPLSLPLNFLHRSIFQVSPSFCLSSLSLSLSPFSLVSLSPLSPISLSHFSPTSPPESFLSPLSLLSLSPLYPTPNGVGNQFSTEALRWRRGRRVGTSDQRRRRRSFVIMIYLFSTFTRNSSP